MKPHRLAVALVMCHAVSCAAAPDTIRRLDGSRIATSEAEAFARQTLAENHVTGAQIAVINHGKLVWSIAYGLAGKDPDRPFDTNTTTWAASITKSVFATYVVSLVEHGQFDLDKPLAQQLSKPIDAYANLRGTASLLAADTAWPHVTPRMVLSHTSGIGNLYTSEPDRKMHIHYQPGSRFLYSGDALNLLQIVLEEKFGKPLDGLIDDAIFKPLGMTRTGMVFRPEFAPDIADRFDHDEKFFSKTRRDTARAAGSMTTNADDLARFLTALLANKIVSATTRQQMLAPQVSIRFAHQFQFGPQADAESAEPQAVGLSYGLGWGLLTHTKFGPAFFKEGHGDGAQNYLICFEKSQSCMILLTNSDNGELAFRPLLERILGNTVIPWEWQCYTTTCIEVSRKNQ